MKKVRTEASVKNQGNIKRVDTKQGHNPLRRDGTTPWYVKPMYDTHDDAHHDSFWIIWRDFGAFTAAVGSLEIS